MIRQLAGSDLDASLEYWASWPPTTPPISSLNESIVELAQNAKAEIERLRKKLAEGCGLHGPCPVCRAEKWLGDPRQAFTMEPRGTFWVNPAPDAAAPAVPSGQCGVTTIRR